MILHCMKRSTWEQRAKCSCWGKRNLERDGFIHCSPPEYWWRVAPNFTNTEEPLVLVCIDEERLLAEVRWEDGDDCGRLYPHIYGLVNNSAVTAVLPFQKDAEGNFVKNPELASYPDR